MKKFIFSCVLSIIAGHMMAQDDDMYFASDKSAKTQKVSSSASGGYSSQRSGGYQSTYDDYTYNPSDYSGSNRDVDEYNRRNRTSVESPYDHDSILISAGEYENYQQMKRWDGYRSTVVVVNDPWYYDPWYSSRYYYYPWYDPWYYDPWYYGSWSWRWGYSWRPYYSSWGWYGRPYYDHGWHHHHTNVRPYGGGTVTYGSRRGSWSNSSEVNRGIGGVRRSTETSGTSVNRRSGNYNSGTGGLRSSTGTSSTRISTNTNTGSSTGIMRRSGVTTSNSGSMRSSGSTTRSNGGFSGGGSSMRSSGGGFSGGGGGMRSSGGGAARRR